jgi:hypothetical protein
MKKWAGYELVATLQKVLKCACTMKVVVMNDETGGKYSGGREQVDKMCVFPVLKARKRFRSQKTFEVSNWDYFLC